MGGGEYDLGEKNGRAPDGDGSDDATSGVRQKVPPVRPVRDISGGEREMDGAEMEVAPVDTSTGVRTDVDPFSSLDGESFQPRNQPDAPKRPSRGLVRDGRAYVTGVVERVATRAMAVVPRPSLVRERPSAVAPANGPLQAPRSVFTGVVEGIPEGEPRAAKVQALRRDLDAYAGEWPHMKELVLLHKMISGFTGGIPILGRVLSLRRRRVEAAVRKYVQEVKAHDFGVDIVHVAFAVITQPESGKVKIRIVVS